LDSISFVLVISDKRIFLNIFPHVNYVL